MKEDFIVERDGRRFINIVKILPENTRRNGRPISWKALNDDRIKVFVKKFGFKGGAVKSVVLNRFTPLSQFLIEGFGLWSGDGIKIQDGELEVFGFSNTEIILIKHFLNFSKNCLGISADEFNIRISVPPNFKNKLVDIEKKVSTELNIPLENFWKSQILVQRNKPSIDVKISSKILSLIVNSLFTNLKQIIESSKVFSASFLRGMIASEGNVHVRRCGRLGEVMIAVHKKQTRIWIRKLFKSLEIKPSKDKEFSGNEGIVVHGFSNFKIMKKWKLCSLHPLKMKLFKNGMNGFREIQFRKGEGKIVILKHLLEGSKTRFQLARLIKRTSSMSKLHLMRLRVLGLVERGNIVQQKRIWKITQEGRKLLLSKDPIKLLKIINSLA